MPVCTTSSKSLSFALTLELACGKKVAQAAHACVKASEIAARDYPNWHEAWQEYHSKIALRGNLPIIESVEKKAEKTGLPYAKITDAGLTQIEPNTITCIAVGPAPRDLIDKITKDLKLL